MQTIHEKSFGVIPVFRQKNKEVLFCIVLHGRGGHWGFPKGHPDPNETEEETAIRELREETSMTDIQLLPEASFTQKYAFENEGITYDKTVKYFLGIVPNMMTDVPEAFKAEILEVKWLPYQELRDLIPYDNAKVLLDDVHEYLKNNSI